MTSHCSQPRKCWDDNDGVEHYGEEILTYNLARMQVSTFQIERSPSARCNLSVLCPLVRRQLITQTSLAPGFVICDLYFEF